MVRKQEFETLQSQPNSKPSFDWYSFVWSWMIAGFEAYGSASTGMAPVRTSAAIDGFHSGEGSLAHKAGNQPVVRAQVQPFRIRPRLEGTTGEEVWSH